MFDGELFGRYEIDTKQNYTDIDRGYIGDSESRSYLLDDIEAETDLVEVIR